MRIREVAPGKVGETKAYTDLKKGHIRLDEHGVLTIAVGTLHEVELTPADQQVLYDALAAPIMSSPV